MTLEKKLQKGIVAQIRRQESIPYLKGYIDSMLHHSDLDNKRTRRYIIIAMNQIGYLEANGGKKNVV